MATNRENLIPLRDLRAWNVYLNGGEALVDKILKKVLEDPAAISSLECVRFPRGLNRIAQLSLRGLQKIKRNRRHKVIEFRYTDCREYVAQLVVKNLEIEFRCPLKICCIPFNDGGVMRIRSTIITIELSVNEDRVMLDFVKTTDIRGISIIRRQSSFFLRNIVNPELYSDLRGSEDSLSHAIDYFISKLINKTLLIHDLLE